MTVYYNGNERLRLVSEEAAYWYFLCVDDPSMLRSDRREFLAWMRKSPENISELFKIAQLDGKLRRLKLAMRSLGLKKSNVVEFTTSGSPYGLHREIEELEEKEARESVNKRTLTFKLAAFAASLFFGVALAFVAQDYMKSEQVITTGVSQWHHMTLDDGTVVHLDAYTKVQVEYTETERIVHIHSGDAVFEVTKDPQRPFIARTPLIDATAVGTRYGVSVGSGVTTTVSEGVVRVTGRDSPEGHSVTLKAGDELRVSGGDFARPTLAKVDADRKLQWATGWLDLQGVTVGQAVDEFNRRNRTQIIIEDPQLEHLKVQFFRVRVDDSPETFARLLTADNSGIKMDSNPKEKVIRLTMAE
jgi:transmembrane sensor